MIYSLVTGGAGFIGAHVSAELIKLGHKVVILDDLSGGFVENIPPGAIFIQGSITDHSLLESTFNQYPFDYIYHLAAYAAEGLSHFVKRFNYNNNLIGSINLINESIKHKVKCFVFTSSIAVYGKAKPPVHEDLIPIPDDPYGVAKLAVEMELRVSREFFGLNYVIFRPHNVYGEFQNIGDKYRNVVGIFMNQLMKGVPLGIFGDGTQTRAFSYVKDVAVPIACCVQNPNTFGQVFNIGAEKEYTIHQLADAVMCAMDLQGQISHLAPRNEVQHIYADHTKARNYFSGIEQTALEVGLKAMASWAKKAGPRKSRNFENIEIYEKMPPSWLEGS